MMGLLSLAGIAIFLAAGAFIVRAVRASSGALKDNSQDGEIALLNARCDELQRQLDVVLDLTLGTNQVEGLAPDKSELSRRLLRRS